MDEKCITPPASSVVGYAAFVARLEAVIEQAVRANMEYIAGLWRARRTLPSLYTTSILYVDDSADTDGQRVWTIPHVIAQGRGACADLAAWRCAELRMGKLAGCFVRIQPRSDDPANKVFHALVTTPEGFEDPSEIMKMRNG